LKVVGNNMKSLEVSEAEASSREDSYEFSIRDLTARLARSEERADQAERQVEMLQKNLDKIEKDYELEREKTNRLQSEMDTAFSELAEM